MGKPHNYPIVPALHDETQLYTQRRRNSEAAMNYRFTIAELKAFLEASGYVKIQGSAPYPSDADAAAGGVAIGAFYEVGPAHEEGAVEGSLKKRIV